MTGPDRLMIFGRLPQPGRTKTRLAPALGAEGAAHLYRAFLADTVATARAIPGVELELWVEPHPDATRWMQDHYPGCRLRWQPEGALGERLRKAFECAFTEGVERAIALGSDHPTLPGSFLSLGFEALAESDAVVGPTEDGGYYAIGFHRGAWPHAASVFRDMPWSTLDLLSRTRERLTQLRLQATELSSWYDIDRPEDLARLGRDAAEESRTAGVLRELWSDAFERSKADAQATPEDRRDGG